MWSITTKEKQMLAMENSRSCPRVGLLTRLVFYAACGCAAATAPLAPRALGAHVWEKQELTFAAAHTYSNAYTEAVVWVDLTGPNFNKRVYGFWDGGQTF